MKRNRVGLVGGVPHSVDLRVGTHHELQLEPGRLVVLLAIVPTALDAQKPDLLLQLDQALLLAEARDRPPVGPERLDRRLVQVHHLTEVIQESQEDMWPRRAVAVLLALLLAVLGVSLARLLHDDDQRGARGEQKAREAGA
eukprot:1330549-Pyramimonas_sp.AAC.1